MLSKIECSDKMLLGILNQDSGRSTELGLQHLNNCEHCQARIEELAANKQQWALAREGLCSRVEGGFELDDIFKITTHPLSDTDRTSDWTDAVAKQLLQPPSHPEMLGRLGRYEIERLVGSGGMGVVFKAYDSELHRSVAIKMLAPHLSGSRSARERFAREARAAAAIVNDHVVPIHNVETEHATPYLVMQYIAGDSLQARLDRDGPLDVCEILRIGMQVATGLAAAHAQGLIHRDVKPSNIMLDENVARALLTDFGLARTQDEACLTRSGFHPGTPHYMSPEQVRGEELDGRSDLFSLGCVLYALCTGHPPYRADSGYAVMRRITDDQPRSIRDQNALIPEWLERVVMRLLEKDRESRFQSAEELAQILEQCLAHVQKPATEPLPLAIAPKASFFDRGRIRNWILAGMASAFLFLAGVFIVLETNKGTITIKSEADNVPIRIKRSDQIVDEMLVSRTGKSVRLAAGEYVIEFDGDSQDLVVEGGNVSLVRGETKTLQIAYRKSDDAETRMSADKSESVIDKSDVDALAQSVSLASAIDAFNRGNSAELIAANSPLLTEDELCAAIWWHANHVDFSPDPRRSLLEIVLSGRLLPGWSIQLKNVQWDEDKLWHGKPATSRAIEINLVNKEQYIAPIRFQFVSSGLESKVPANSPLADAIAEFNKHEAGDQPPLTLHETLAALSTLWSKEPSRHPEEPKLSDDAVSILKQIADQHTMDGHSIESSLEEHEVGDSKFLTWKIQLRVKAHEGFLGTQWFLIRKRFIKVESDRISARRSQAAALHTYQEPSNISDFSKPKGATPEGVSDLALAVNNFNLAHTEKMRSANTPPLTEDELVASLWWQYSQSKLREEIHETVKEIVITRKLPLGWSIKLNTHSWTLPQQWWHDKPLSSSAIQINLFGKEGLATTIRNRFISSDISSIRPPESALEKAIEEFNMSHSEEEPGLTLDETLAALSTLWDKQSWYSYDGLKPSTMDALMAVIDRHEMKGVKIKLLHSYQTAEEDRFDVSAIRLEVQDDQDGSIQAFTIRERFQKVNSFSDETIHWGKPSDEGLQAGFRFKPAQTRYLSGQVVDVEFFYRTIQGKGLTATIPNIFHFNKIDIDVLGNDGKQRLSVEHDREKIIGGWRAEEIGEQPTLFKNRKIRFVDSPEKLAAAKQIPDDWTTNVMLPINTKCDITFDVPDFADTAKKSASLLTGSTQFTILNGSDDKRQLGIAPYASATPRDNHISFLQSALDSVKLKFDEGIATQEEVLSAELELLGAKIAGTKDVKSLSSLLKQREDAVQRAFLAADGNQSSVFKSLEILAKSENIPTDRIRAEANKTAQQIENELGREGLWRTLELVVHVDLRERRTNAVGRLNGNPLQPLIQLDGDLSELLESTLPMQLRELAIELAQPQGPKWIQVGYSWNIQSSQSFAVHLQQMHERHQSLGVDEAFLESTELPNEFSATTSAGLVAFLKETKGMPALLAFSRDLSISNVAESIEKNLGFDSIDMLNGAFRKWIEEKYALAEHLTSTEGVEVRTNSQHDSQPFPKVIYPVDTTSEASKVDSQSLETMKLRKEVEQLKKLFDRGGSVGGEQLIHVRQLPFPKEMQGVWRIKEAFKGVVEKNGRIALAQYENQIVTISDSTMFLQSNVVGNYWYLSRLDSSSSTMQVDLSVRSGSDSVYKTFACLLEIQGDKLSLVRAESPGFPRPQSVQELRRGEKCFVMTRIGDSPMTPKEVIQVVKEKVFEKEDRTVRFKVELVHAPFVLGEPSDGHREGELHLDCRPDPHDFSLDQFLVVLTAECQKKLLSEGVEDITKHFLGKTITAKGPVRGVEYTARAMQGEHFHLIIDDPSKLIIDPSE